MMKHIADTHAHSLFLNARGLAGAGALALLLVILTGGCDKEEEMQANAQPLHVTTAQDGICLTVTANKPTITTAERLAVSIDVEAIEDADVSWPNLPESWGDWTVLAQHPHKPSLIDQQRVRHRLTLELEPFLPGTSNVPQLTIPVQLPEREKEASLTSKPLEITITSVLDSQDKPALAPIEGALTPPPESRPLWQWIVLGFITVILGSVVTALLLRRPDGRQVAATPPRPAHEIALEAMDALLRERHIEEGRPDAFFFGLTTILRRYIEQRFGLRAPEQTTDEFLHDLHKTDRLSAPQKELMRTFLTQADLIKFARATPAPADVDHALASCRRFILETAQAHSDGEDGHAL